MHDTNRSVKISMAHKLYKAVQDLISGNILLHNLWSGKIGSNVISIDLHLRLFGRPFVKQFALCYRTVVLSVLSVCL